MAACPREGADDAGVDDDDDDDDSALGGSWAARAGPSVASSTRRGAPGDWYRAFGTLVPVTRADAAAPSSPPPPPSSSGATHEHSSNPAADRLARITKPDASVRRQARTRAPHTTGQRGEAGSRGWWTIR
jgi:hypothetical protein